MSEEKTEEEQYNDVKNKLSVLDALHKVSQKIELSIDAKVYLKTLQEGVFMIRAKYLLNKLDISIVVKSNETTPNVNSEDFKREGELLDKFSRTKNTTILLRDKPILEKLAESGEFMLEAKLELELLELYKDQRLKYELRLKSKGMMKVFNSGFKPEKNKPLIRETTRLGVVMGGSLKKTKKRYKK